MKPFFRVVSRASPVRRIVALGSGRAVAIEVEEENESEVEKEAEVKVEAASSPQDPLSAAKEHFAALQRMDSPAPPAAPKDEQRSLEQAWRLGQALSALKRQAGHGRWLALLAAEFPLLSHQNAGRYRRFFHANSPPKTAGEEAVPASFHPETIRRLRWNYVPAKERPAPGSVPATPARLSLVGRRVVSALRRWEGLLASGRLDPKAEAKAVEALRQECGPMVKRLAERLGREYVCELLAQYTDQDPGSK